MLDSGKTNKKYKENSEVNEVIDDLLKEYEKCDAAVEQGNKRVHGIDGENAQMMQYFKNSTSEIMSSLATSIYSTKIKLEKQGQAE